METIPEHLLNLHVKLLPLYRVILFNDEIHEMNYVVQSLLRYINGMTQDKAVQTMIVAHLKGNAIVALCPKELAEYYQECLLRCGLVVGIEPDGA